MSKHIVITSIFKPTEAVQKFSSLAGYSLTVVGDNKSPVHWEHPGVHYLSVQKQNLLEHRILKHLPFNHYCRKMVGYLEVIEKGATVIIDTDDDNIPLSDWSFPSFNENYFTLPNNKGFVNVYKLFTKKPLWPRGLPLRFIKEDNLTPEGIENKDVAVGVWQGLANGEPDVDAIYRLVNNDPCVFDEKGPYVLGTNTVTPFNSQNTAFRKELFACLYLPSFVSFRYTDILRGLISQPIMWAAGYKLGFTKATVHQERNPHNFMDDFQSEIPMYLTAEKAYEIALSTVSKSRTVSDNLHHCYRALQDENIVNENELRCLDSWLYDVDRLMQRTC